MTIYNDFNKTVAKYIIKENLIEVIYTQWMYKNSITPYNCMNTKLTICLPLQYEIPNNDNSEATKNHIECTRSMLLCLHIKILKRNANSSTNKTILIQENKNLAM